MEIKLDFSFIFKLSYINILPIQNSNTKNPTKTTDWFYMMEMKRNLKSYRNHTIKSIQEYNFHKLQARRYPTRRASEDPFISSNRVTHRECVDFNRTPFNMA